LTIFALQMRWRPISVNILNMLYVTGMMDEAMIKYQITITKQRQHGIFVDHCDLDIVLLFGNCDLIIGYCPLL
jgi:hypothetical protein